MFESLEPTCPHPPIRSPPIGAGDTPPGHLRGERVSLSPTSEVAVRPPTYQHQQVTRSLESVCVCACVRVFACACG